MVQEFLFFIFFFHFIQPWYNMESERLIIYLPFKHGPLFYPKTPWLQLCSLSFIPVPIITTFSIYLRTFHFSEFQVPHSQNHPIYMAESAETKNIIDPARVEIDTSPPFESVKEAVDHFGGSGHWIPPHLAAPPNVIASFLPSSFNTWNVMVWSVCVGNTVIFI